MEDIIQGSVINVVDGDTFDMAVEKVGTNNTYTYNDQETIRIAGIDEPELNTTSGQRSKKALESELLHKRVRCYVQTRDKYGRLVCYVKKFVKRLYRRKK